MLTPDEFGQQVMDWAKQFPSTHKAANILKQRMLNDCLYNIGVVTATKRCQGLVERATYEECYAIWRVITA